jgi:hypothetical protein
MTAAHSAKDGQDNGQTEAITQNNGLHMPSSMGSEAYGGDSFRNGRCLANTVHNGQEGPIIANWHAISGWTDV